MSVVQRPLSSAPVTRLCAAHLIFCRPCAPEGKGKLKRWRRTCRDQFLGELDERRITDLADLNARLWAWPEQVHCPERVFQWWM